MDWSIHNTVPNLEMHSKFHNPVLGGATWRYSAENETIQERFVLFVGKTSGMEMRCNEMGSVGRKKVGAGKTKLVFLIH